jgi:hypothetical protein
LISTPHHTPPGRRRQSTPCRRARSGFSPPSSLAICSSWRIFARWLDLLCSSELRIAHHHQVVADGGVRSPSLSSARRSDRGPGSEALNKVREGKGKRARGTSLSDSSLALCAFPPVLHLSSTSEKLLCNRSSDDVILPVARTREGGFRLDCWRRRK